MAAFLSAQLDFVYFCYGLAFLLLGTASLTIARFRQSGSWMILGIFGLAHGSAEWLHLLAHATGNWPGVMAASTALMLVSYVLLLEFARQELVCPGGSALTRWLYVPLVLTVAVAGIAGGLSMAQVAARYLIGFPGAIAAGLAFARRARTAETGSWPFAVAAVAFCLYAVAAGVLVPVAAIWPATVLNDEWFFESTGVPVQLVRGLLASCIAVSIFAIRGQFLVDEAAALYSRYFQQQIIGALVAITLILGCGWLLTEHLGKIYERKAVSEASGELGLVAGRLDGELSRIKGMARVIAGAPTVQRLLIGSVDHDGERLLGLAVETTGADTGYVIDTSGAILIAFGNRQSALLKNRFFSSTHFAEVAAIGKAADGLVFDAERGATTYYASHPVEGAAGDATGVAVLMTSLTAFNEALGRYDRSFYLLDPDGVIVVTNRREMLFRKMWPTLVATPSRPPVLKNEILHHDWQIIEGERGYLKRRFLNAEGWSLVIFRPVQEAVAGRALGICLTLLMTLMMLIYVSESGRSVYDRIQLMKRLELQELATELKLCSITDPLTGLRNRRRFDEMLALEILRAKRYATPLSLVLYDIDHFKQINDTYGHLVGDKVLTQLSELIASRVRGTDELSRWGGEEFAILLPGVSAAQAFTLAEELRRTVGDTAFGEVGTVTCSFGVAQYEVSESAEAFLARTDAAVYRAKKKGRNTIEFAARCARQQFASESAA